MDLKMLVGSGDKIGLLVLPFIVTGLVLNVIYPHLFNIGGPQQALKIVSVILLIIGIVNWLWSVLLILTKVPRNELITTGPFSLVKHPLYTGAAFLVLPWLGFLLNTWLGALIGIILYIGVRMFAPEEEKHLSRSFGPRWDRYCKKVKLPWL